MSAIDYNDPDLAVGGDWVKWEMVGQTVIATVTGFKKQSRLKTDGSTVVNGVYSLREDDGTEVNIEVGQAFLKGLFKEKQVQIGDRIKIVYTSDERLPGKPSPMKKFSLDVSRGGAAPAQTTTEAAHALLESQLGAKAVDSAPAPF